MSKKRTQKATSQPRKAGRPKGTRSGPRGQTKRYIDAVDALPPARRTGTALVEIARAQGLELATARQMLRRWRPDLAKLLPLPTANK